MVFVVAWLVLGPSLAGVLDLSLDSHVVLTFTELTLAAPAVRRRDDGSVALRRR